MLNNEQVEVSFSGLSKIPVLSSGELTIEVFLHWKNMCENFFEVKEIDDRDEKKCIILAMTDWVVHVETLNANLIGTPSHKNEQQLHAHIKSVMCNQLAQLAEVTNTSSILAYRDWKVKLITLDNDCLAIMNEVLHLAGKLSVTNSRNSAFSSSLSANASSSNLSKRTTQKHPPPLIAVKHTLLMKHGGCFKCYKFYASHHQLHCMKLLSQAADYCKLTEDDTTKAKHTRELKPKVKQEATAAAHLEEKVVGEFVTAVGCESPVVCSVLEYGSDSDYTECVIAAVPLSISSISPDVKPFSSQPDLSVKTSLFTTFYALCHCA
ncbi:hypothetical protein BDY19DRAFT_991478 [Irpex rosettiformis]|uniref:Uncharacterized protein n=1 Tax=Irpex rosettiformis TaxID=378272 RepID=A0ACB8UC37_9APHY|nr:hypothetical protein BDY19DRAFT_991478 [Irpex rosettiformis]